MSDAEPHAPGADPAAAPPPAEASSASAPPTTGSSLLTRYAVPLGIIWSGGLLSAFVYSKLPPGTELEPLRAFASFFAGPVLSLAGFLVIRLVRRGVRAANARGEDLVVAWVMTFLLGVHCLILALSLGLLSSLDRALPLATFLLFLGLGPVLAQLEPGSAMGIRTRATLTSPKAWADTHRLVGWLLPLGGLCGLGALALEGGLALLVAVLPGLLALVVAITYGATRPAGGGEG